MRNCFLCIFFTAAVCFAAEPLTISMPFSQGLPGWWTNAKKLFIVIDGDPDSQLLITGNQEQELGYQRMIGQVKEVSAEQLSGQNWRLSFQSLVSKLRGAIKVEIRQINDAGTSVHYNTIRLCQFDEKDSWQQYSLDCRMSAQTSKINIHITADFLRPEDMVYIRQLKLQKINPTP